MMDLTLIDAEEFSESYRSAKMYHYRAVQFLNQGQNFSIVFNVACVALENYLIALCALYGEEPYNHNFICLMNAAEKVVEFPSSLNKEIRSLDVNVFGICSLENYYHRDPQEEDGAKVLKICEMVYGLFDQNRVEFLGKHSNGIILQNQAADLFFTAFMREVLV